MQTDTRGVGLALTVEQLHSDDLQVYRRVELSTVLQQPPDPVIRTVPRQAAFEPRLILHNMLAAGLDSINQVDSSSLIEHQLE
jgi:hypothetical protein